MKTSDGRNLEEIWQVDDALISKALTVRVRAIGITKERPVVDSGQLSFRVLINESNPQP